MSQCGFRNAKSNRLNHFENNSIRTIKTSDLVVTDLIFSKRFSDLFSPPLFAS